MLVPVEPGPGLRARRLIQPPIADYALLGDCRSAALVSRAGSIDWLCWPRFDSPACLASLLGTEENGRWSIAPASPTLRVTRAYRTGTLILETLFEIDGGAVAVIDFMPPHTGSPTLIRIVEGRFGQVPVRMALAPRFDYGAAIPWLTELSDGSGFSAIAGPDQLVLRAGVPAQKAGQDITAAFDIAAGERETFVLTHNASHLPPAEPVDAFAELDRTAAFWAGWHTPDARPWAVPVAQSLVVLKAMTYAPTGGIVAAPTTSLPERPGGSRNWDYRFCWLRDSALTIRSLLRAGHMSEAVAWRDWLLRAIGGSASQVHTIYGLAGERRLAEWEADWLSGYEGAKPVRIGNGAAGQLQIDVFGELMDTLYLAAKSGLPAGGPIWDLQVALLAQLQSTWAAPDEGIWEVRGGRQHFTYSKVMAWVAFDRAIATATEFSLPAPIDGWRATRARIHETVLRDGYNAARGSFTQSFASEALDASLLQMPLVGFLPVGDPRIAATIAAIERELTQDGLVLRYRTEETKDGLPPGEGVFLACSFWLVEVMALQGRHAEAAALFERLLALRNDLGLLAEEYDPRTGRLLGNFPQAFSHLALVDAARRLRG